MTPVLETERLWLKPLTLADAPAIQRRFAQWAVVRLLSARIPWPYPADGSEVFIRQAIEERREGLKHRWGVWVKDGPQEPVGGIDLWPDEGNRDNRGFWLDSAFQGRGYMIEAADRVTAFAFDDLDWPHLWLTNAEPNTRSARIKERQGAVLIDTEVADYVSGRFGRQIWLLTREAWLSARAAPHSSATAAPPAPPPPAP